MNIKSHTDKQNRTSLNDIRIYIKPECWSNEYIWQDTIPYLSQDIVSMLNNYGYRSPYYLTMREIYEKDVNLFRGLLYRYFDMVDLTEEEHDIQKIGFELRRGYVMFLNEKVTSYIDAIKNKSKEAIMVMLRCGFLPTNDEIEMISLFDKNLAVSILKRIGI